jgi:tetratricopeptide (TPR) repeat protein
MPPATPEEPQARIDSTVVSADQRVLEAIACGQLDQAKALMQKLVALSPDAKACVAELLPCLYSAKRGDLEGAFFRLTRETTFPSSAGDALLAYVAEALRAAGNVELAAAAWLALPDDPAAANGAALLAKLRMDAATLEARTLQAGVLYYRGRVTADEGDATAWERLGALILTTGTPTAAEEATQACDRALALDPQRRGAWQTQAEAMVRAGKNQVAVTHLQKAARVYSGQSWPHVLLAGLYANHLDDLDNAILSASKAIAAAPGDRQILLMQRGLLRRGARWFELAQVIEELTATTLRMSEHAELHDELADLLFAKMNEPLESIEVRKRAAWFRDTPAVTAFYWQSLEEAGNRLEAWDEVEEFFRVNALWDDLIDLLYKRVEQTNGPRLLVAYDRLIALYENFPQLPAAELVAAILDEMNRAKEPAMRLHLETRLDAFRAGQAGHVAVPAPPTPKSDAPSSALMLVAGLLLAVLIVLVLWAYAT